MKKQINLKYIHIAIIVFGIIFNSLSIFQTNLWFDEAYSVGLASKSFADIWRIGSHDVHPVLYYWILHIIYCISNGNIIAYRIFSMSCISILSILGFTHIRKDFGEKVGILFSFFSLFLPTICVFSAEVRMYSLAVVLVTLLAIYAYRIMQYSKNRDSKKDDSKKSITKEWIIFAITSLASIYVHYYGLMAAGIINVILLIYVIKNKEKDLIIKIIISGIIQAILYIPWVMALIGQMKHVSSGFWIGFVFPQTLMEILSSQFIGNIIYEVGFALSLILYGYLIFKACQAKKNNEQISPAIIAISIYGAVIVAALLVTLVLQTSILYYRYLFVITGLFIFFISYFLAKEKNKYVILGICIITFGLATWSNISQIQEVYDKSNHEPIEYLKQNVQPGDVFAFEENNFGTGSIVSLNFLDHDQYYYNPSDWGIAEAYEAFGKQLHVYLNEDFLNECNGRIWIIDNENGDYYKNVFDNENYRLIQHKEIQTKYEGYKYNFSLVEKVKK